MQNINLETAAAALVLSAVVPVVADAAQTTTPNHDSQNKSVSKQDYRIRPKPVTLDVSKLTNGQVALKIKTEMLFEVTGDKNELYIRFAGPIEFLQEDNPLDGFGAKFQSFQSYHGYNTLLLTWKAPLKGSWRKVEGEKHALVFNTAKRAKTKSNLREILMELTGFIFDENTDLSQSSTTDDSFKLNQQEILLGLTEYSSTIKADEIIDKLKSGKVDLSQNDLLLELTKSHSGDERDVKANWLDVDWERQILVLQGDSSSQPQHSDSDDGELLDESTEALFNLDQLRWQLQNKITKKLGGVPLVKNNTKLELKQLVYRAQSLEDAGFWQEALLDYDRALLNDPMNNELIKEKMALLRQHKGEWQTGLSYTNNSADDLIKKDLFTNVNFAVSNKLRLTTGLSLSQIVAPDPWLVDVDVIEKNSLLWGVGVEHNDLTIGKSALNIAGQLKPGLLLTHITKGESGGWEAKGKLYYPENGDISGRLHQAQRDQLGFGRYDDWWDTLQSRLFAAVNRYHIQGYSNAAKSINIDLSWQWSPEDYPLSLGYALAWENPSYLLTSTKEDGSSFEPYPRPEKESHTISVGWQDVSSRVLTRSLLISDTFDSLSNKHSLGLGLVGNWYWQDDHVLDVKMDFGLDITEQSTTPFFFLSFSHSLQFI
ncbi:MAG: hypothetical protein HQL69_03320 [Magnetococcales bacterium]|nr:hypothetical protein [Magnetococcales bacterium]